MVRRWRLIGYFPILYNPSPPLSPTAGDVPVLPLPVLQQHRRKLPEGAATDSPEILLDGSAMLAQYSSVSVSAAAVTVRAAAAAPPRGGAHG